jgi:chromosome segregation ATPase
MINLEQIQKLEARVNKAVELIKTLKAENQSLRRTLDSAQNRMEELETLVKDFKSDQKDIERSILRALENLNELEDEISDAASERTPSTDGPLSAGGIDEAETGEAGVQPAGENQETVEEAEEESTSADGELDIF